MARWQPRGNPDDPPTSGVLPRYRRLLGVGAVLDVSVHLFRQNWITLATFGLVALVPSWLVIMLMYVGGFQRNLVTATSGSTLASTLFAVQQLGTVIVLGLVSGAFGLLWAAASTAAAYALMRGQQPRLSHVYRDALARFPTILGSTLVFLIGFVVLLAISSVLAAITLFVVGLLVAVIGLLYWWRVPEGRRRWLKWLIILTAPFGLVTYYSVRWALLIPIIVVERRGPIEALRRSSELTDRAWFRTWAVLVLVSVIVVVLVSVPASLAALIFSLVAAPLAAGPGSQALSMLNSTVNSVCQVLFSSIATISYVVLFLDLRNRREGTDLGDRIGSLEAAPG